MFRSYVLILASCINGVAISWAGINAQGYVTATTFMARTAPPPTCVNIPATPCV